jgi:hypothetical protein
MKRQGTNFGVFSHVYVQVPTYEGAISDLDVERFVCGLLRVGH